MIKKHQRGNIKKSSKTMLTVQIWGDLPNYVISLHVVWLKSEDDITWDRNTIISSAPLLWLVAEIWSQYIIFLKFLFIIHICIVVVVNQTNCAEVRSGYRERKANWGDLWWPQVKKARWRRIFLFGPMAGQWSSWWGRWGRETRCLTFEIILVEQSLSKVFYWLLQRWRRW